MSRNSKIANKNTSCRKVRTHLVQMDVEPGRPSINTDRMLGFIEQAKNDGSELIVFPEMAVPGRLVGDAWEMEAFLRECEACGNRIREASDNVIIVFGNVAMDWDRRNEDGRVRKYNALFVAEDGRFTGPVNGPYPFVVKTLYPDFREFDDSRHFYDLQKLAFEEGTTVERMVSPVATRNLMLGCCIMREDAGESDNRFSPLTMLGRHPINLIIAIGCSSFAVNRSRKRDQLLSSHASELQKPLVYVNNIGVQNTGKTVYMFDGWSCIYNGAGDPVCRRAAFDEGVSAFDLPLSGSEKFGVPVEVPEDGIGNICEALLYGARKFMKQIGVSKVAVGISGGIDSAVVAALYSRILSRENLLLVNMPSRFTSQVTLKQARELAENLGCYYAEIPIEDGVALTASEVSGLEIAGMDRTMRMRLQLSDFMMENVQARDRSARLLAAISAAFGGVFSCNANKSEATVGYTTLYGDLGGYLAIIADLWKGEIYELARYLNEQVFKREVIPKGCMDVVPSAELGPEQNVDEGKGDPLIFPYHDRLFASWVEWRNRASPEDILEWYIEGVLEERIGYDGKIADVFPDNQAFIADLERWWGQYQGLGAAKRIQSPPVLAVKQRSFGFDLREAQMKAWTSQRYNELKERIVPLPP